MAELMPVEEAQRTIWSAVEPGPTMRVPLRSAQGCVLAEDVVCDIDYPPFDRAVMDGYAVRAADLATVPATLTVVGQVQAGGAGALAVSPGQAVQINTGAPVPSDCDAVVRVEDTELARNQVTIHAAASPGQYITTRAEFVSAGATVLEAGTRLTPGRIGIAAAAGAAVVSVYDQPTVGILVTGNELVGPQVTPAEGQIRDSNRYVLDALIRQCGCMPIDVGVARDDRQALTDAIKRGLRCGFLCVTGGISMGAFDLVPDALVECGATLRIRKLALKPGKPTIFATTDDAHVFALPGNPVSVFTAFWLLVRPALARRQGLTADPPAVLRATLSAPVGATGPRQTYRPARVAVGDDGQLLAEPLSWGGSGDPFGLALANALLVSAPGSPAGAAGDSAGVILLDVP